MEKEDKYHCKYGQLNDENREAAFYPDHMTWGAEVELARRKYQQGGLESAAMFEGKFEVLGMGTSSTGFDKTFLRGD